MADTTAPGVYAYEVDVKMTFKVATEPGSPATAMSEADDLTMLNGAVREILDESILGIVADGLIVEVSSKREEVSQ